jgi:glycerophosphoryl diester phosphodiesterase
MSKVEIIAHRGAWHDAPENTLASISVAWQQLADAVELDILLSKDGVIVVTHDPNTVRTTGNNGEIAKMTLAEIQSLGFMDWKDSAYANERIPTLGSALKELPAGKRLLVEIKEDREVILPVLKTVIETSGVHTGQITLIGFNYDIMKAAKATMPALGVLWLLAASRVADTVNFPAQLEGMIKLSQEARFEGLNVNYRWPIDRHLLQRLGDEGLKLYAATVDDASIAHKLVEAGVHGITTNRPLWLREQLQKKIAELPH